MKEPLDKPNDSPQTCQKIAIKYCNEEICNGYLQNKYRNVDFKHKWCKKTIKKGGIILRQAVDNLIKIKHGKDMTAGEMKNQTHRNCITSILSPHMSELGKKVPDHSDWLFGDNIVSRINQIKAKQPAL